MYFWKTLALAVTITLIGAILRLYQLTDIPPSLNWDEVSHAYTAYSLLESGKDQWGHTLPLFNFRAYGDYPTTLNVYLTVPAVALLGPTDLAARLSQALLGSLTIVAAFLAGYFWRRRVDLALFTAFLVAVEPWTLFTSRQILQSNGAVFLLFLGLAWWLRRKSPWVLALSLLAYHNTRLFMPLLAGGIALVSLGRNKWLAWMTIAVAGGLLLLSPTARSRSPWVGILNSGAVAYLEQARTLSTWPTVLTKLVYNRPLYFVQKAAANYVEYFLPAFLFLDGGTQYQYSTPGWGVMQVANLPFFYVGLIPGLLTAPWLIWWLVASVVPAAITVDRFAVVRATTMIPAVYLLTAAGFVWVLDKLRGRWRYFLVGSYLVVHAGLTLNYLGNYAGSYTQGYSASWQYGYRQVVDYAKNHYQDYDQIIFTKKYGEPHEYVLWYWPWEPASLATQLIWDFHDGWYWVNALDKFRFVNDWEMQDYVANLPIGGRYLIIASPVTIPDGPQIGQINFLDGQPAFILKEKL